MASNHPDVRMDSDDPEVRKAYVNVTVHDALNATDHLISYFSCWRRLKVAVAWFLRLKGLWTTDWSSGRQRGYC